jgi:outer membrane protein assembly factor BamB
MKFKRFALPFLLILLTFLLSACSGQANTTNFPGLALHGETVYLSEGVSIYAVNVTSGQESRLGEVPLRYPIKAEANTSLFAPTAFLSDGQLIIPNSHPSEHSLFSLDPQTGNVRWAFQKSKGTWVAGALTLETDIYAPGGDGILYALDANGNERWTQKLSEHGLWAHPISDGTLIYQSSMDDTLFALDPTTGTQIWQAALGNPLLSAPALDETGTLYVGTLAGDLYAVNSSDGSILWRTDLEGNIWSTPTIQGDSLYIGTLFNRQGKFYAIDKTSGQIIWQRDEETAIIASPLALEGQVIYVTEAGRVQALTSTGSPQWQADLKGKLLVAPVLAGDVFIVAPLQGDYLLVAFDLNGAQKWTFKPEN